MAKKPLKASGVKVIVRRRDKDDLSWWVPFGPGYTAKSAGEAWRAVELSLEAFLADDK